MVLREKFTALNAYIRKEGKISKNNPSSHLKDLEKHKHNKPKGRRKEITKSRYPKKWKQEKRGIDGKTGSLKISNLKLIN